MTAAEYARRSRVGRWAGALKRAAQADIDVLRRSLRLEPDHYDNALSRDRAVALFKRHVELIEVETTSYCNRTCSFCPNSFIDRRGEKSPMPEECWAAILRDLRACDYDGSFIWSRYSEPTSEDRLLTRVREVREAAPRARICMNSNGDYLNRESLAALIDAGLERLLIDIYLPDSDVYDLSAARRGHDRFLKQIGATATLTGETPELASRIEGLGIEAFIHVRNNASMKPKMSNRAGLLDSGREFVRESPCYAPFRHLVIDWDGSVVPCCQMRSDVDALKDAVVTKIGVNGVGPVDAYVALAGWRDSLKTFGPKSGPCASCNVEDRPRTWFSEPVARALSNDRSLAVRAAKRAGRAVLKKHARWYGPGS
jgi:MoaA/NifB/PqqE/SkfB family radical SAM enzyme